MAERNSDGTSVRTGPGPDDAALLARNPLFASLDPSRLHNLLADARVRTIERNETLFIQDEPATAFFLVLAGWVKIYRLSAHGEESIINVFTRGESFAEAAIFEAGTYPVTAQAAEPSRLLVIPAASFLEKLRHDPDLCFNIMGSMSRHLRALVGQVEQLTTKSSAQRLAAFLLRLSPQRKGAIELHLPVDKSLIAGRLGMQPETLSRSFSKLRMLGVETDQNRIAIADVEALRVFTRD